MVVDLQRAQHLISSSEFDVNFHVPVGSTVLNVSVINNNATSGAVFSTIKYMNDTAFILKTESGFSSGESVTGITNSFSSKDEYKFPRNVGIPRVLLTSLNESGTDLLMDYIVTYEYQPPEKNTAPGGRI